MEKKLRLGVERLGGVCWKMGGEEGMPDRIVLLPGGRTIWVETKRPSGRLSGMQLYQHGRLHRLGQDVRVLWSAEAVEEFIKEQGP